MTSQKAPRYLVLVAFIAVILVCLILVNGPSAIMMPVMKIKDRLKTSASKMAPWTDSKMADVQNLNLSSKYSEEGAKMNKDGILKEKIKVHLGQTKAMSKMAPGRDSSSPRSSQRISSREDRFEMGDSDVRDDTNAKMERNNGTLYNTMTDLYGLVKTLTQKIQSATVKVIEMKPTCHSNETISNSCQESKKCLRMEIPKDIKSRVAQLVDAPNLQLSKDIHKVLGEMAAKVTGQYDVILLSAASSNHYFESQAMIKNVHQFVFPLFRNFTFLFYDLGLSPTEHRAMEKYCRCQVLDFPFAKLPDFIRNLHCYSWKPIVIKAHVEQANVVIWADASVRFHSQPDHLKEIVERTRQRGLQIGGSNNASPFRTFRSMYHFFGDEPCAYLEMGQAKATVGFYAREPFVIRAILEPWVACAVHKECMCQAYKEDPKYPGCAESKQMAIRWAHNVGNISYGLCNRFDQSAISLILHKLYRGYYRWVMVNVLQYVKFRRKHTEIYFPE